MGARPGGERVEERRAPALAPVPRVHADLLHVGPPVEDEGDEVAHGAIGRVDGHPRAARDPEGLEVHERRRLLRGDRGEPHPGEGRAGRDLDPAQGGDLAGRRGADHGGHARSGGASAGRRACSGRRTRRRGLRGGGTAPGVGPEGGDDLRVGDRTAVERELQLAARAHQRDGLPAAATSCHPAGFYP